MSHLNRPFVPFLLRLLSLVATARSASAEVTRIEFTSKQPFGTFRAGDYVIWQGKIHGDLAPQEAIPGIDKAARNERGRIDYAAKIILMMPAAPRAGNGALLVDVPNRGRVYAEALYNSPRDAPFLSGHAGARHRLSPGPWFCGCRGPLGARTGRGPAFVRRHRWQDTLCRGGGLCDRARRRGFPRARGH